MSMRAVSLVEAALYLCYNILEIIKPNQFDDGIYSEGALMRTNGKGGAPMKDDQIVNLYWDRNEDAIHQTQMKYGAYLAKVAYNILADYEDSEECVNDTYLAAWNSMPTNRPNVLSTYLSKITRQITIDMFRKKNRLKRYASEYAISLEEFGDSFADGTTPEQELDAKLLIDAINRFLRTLPNDARNTFIGRYYFFDSLKEVAAYCGMSESKAKSMLYRTRQSLKAYLEKEGFDL